MYTELCGTILGLEFRGAEALGANERERSGIGSVGWIVEIDAGYPASRGVVLEEKIICRSEVWRAQQKGGTGSRLKEQRTLPFDGERESAICTYDIERIPSLFKVTVCMSHASSRALPALSWYRGSSTHLITLEIESC